MHLATYRCMHILNQWRNHFWWKQNINLRKILQVFRYILDYANILLQSPFPYNFHKDINPLSRFVYSRQLDSLLLSHKYQHIRPYQMGKQVARTNRVQVLKSHWVKKSLCQNLKLLSDDSKSLAELICRDIIQANYTVKAEKR